MVILYHLVNNPLLSVMFESARQTFPTSPPQASLIKTKIIVKDFDFGKATFYRVNAIKNMVIPYDSESAMAKGLHLLLYNEYLLMVKKKSPINKAVKCYDLLVYKAD